MPNILQILENDAFQMSSLTAAVQKLPYVERRLGQLGLFENNLLDTNVVVIDENEGQLEVFSTKPRGGESNVPKKDKDRKSRAFVIPHIPVKDRIMAATLQGKRKTGQTELESVVEKVNDRFQYMRNNLETTFEVHRLNALKGIVVDADGSTLLNLFTAFDVAQSTFDFELSSASLDVRERCVQLSRAQEDKLGGIPFTKSHVLCGRNFFDELVAHPKVRDTFIYQEGATLRQDLRKGFEIGGHFFEEYRGVRGLVNDIGQIDDDEAYAIPLGVQGLFRANFAPGDFMNTVNTVADPMYARVVPDRDLEKWVDLYMETNPLLMTTRPDTIYKLTKS